MKKEPPVTKRRQREANSSSGSWLQRIAIGSCMILVFGLAVIGLMTLAGHGKEFRVITITEPAAKPPENTAMAQIYPHKDLPYDLPENKELSERLFTHEQLTEAYNRGREVAYKQFLEQQKKVQYRLPAAERIRHKMSFESRREALSYARQVNKNASALMRQRSYTQEAVCRELLKLLTTGRAALTLVTGAPAEARLVKQMLEDHLNSVHAFVMTTDWAIKLKQQLMTMEATVELLGNAARVKIVRKQGIGQANSYAVTVSLQNDNPAIVKNLKVLMKPYDELHAYLPPMLLTGPGSLEPGAVAQYTGNYNSQRAERISGFEVQVTVD